MGYRQPSPNLTITIPGSNTPPKTPTRHWHSLESDIYPSTIHKASVPFGNAHPNLNLLVEVKVATASVLLIYFTHLLLSVVNVMKGRAVSRY